MMHIQLQMVQERFTRMLPVRKKQITRVIQPVGQHLWKTRKGDVLGRNPSTDWVVLRLSAVTCELEFSGEVG